jgi:hypothetical protein
MSFAQSPNPNAVASGMRDDAIRERTRGKVTLTEDTRSIAAPDLNKMQEKSDELNRLAKELDTDLANVRKGVVPAEMSHRLKRIEKLAKEIRQGIQ